MKLSFLFKLHPWMSSGGLNLLQNYIICTSAEVLQQDQRIRLFSVTEQLKNKQTGVCGLYVGLLRNRFGPHLINEWIFLFHFFYTYTISDNQQNRPQHPDVHVHCKKSRTWQHIDWIEHWVYCTAEARHTTSHTVAMEKITLMEPESSCGRSAMYVQCFTLFISYSIAFPSSHNKTNILMVSRPCGINFRQMFT